ncbi:MAG: beta-lactamase [bacterium]|nr:MAG: beta-lactamase [bacterium]
MVKNFIVSILLCLLLTCLTIAQDKNPLEKRVDDVVGLFRNAPTGYEKIFAKSFLDQVPNAQLTQIFTDFFNQLGRCVKTNHLTSDSPGVDKFDLIFEKGFSVPMTIVVDANEPHYISSLLLGNPSPLVSNFNQLLANLKKLPGETSFIAAKIKDGKLETLATHNPDSPLAIGSAFKLYVLSELVRTIKTGEHKWTDVITLKADSLSLPSGIIHKWPIGSPITLHTLASLMISISDNTATDQLVQFLGREKIEKILALTGNAKPDRNIPFLKTIELFKLKLDPSGKSAEIYLAKDINARREMLNNEISKMDKQTLKPFPKPLYIDKLEWFASANDMCRLMNWLHEQTQSDLTKPARDILAINPGLSISEKDWPYIGFKGGSEPGVLNLTYLLQSSKGQWYFLSLTCNDPNTPIDEAKLFAITQRAIDLLN